MNKNNMFSEKPPSKGTAMPVHPVWRGIGFIMIILIPALSYVATLRLLELNGQKGWYPIPPEFLIYFRNFDPYILVKSGFDPGYLIYCLYSILADHLFPEYPFWSQTVYPPRYSPSEKKEEK